MRAAVHRLAHFNAAHRLHHPAWSEAKNQQVFGKCNNPHYHGHNYLLDVGVKGDIDPDTGYVYDMKALSDLIEAKVVERLDHKNLNVEVDEFKTLNPTAENIAAVIYKWLRVDIATQFELKIKLYETERNFVEYPA